MSLAAWGSAAAHICATPQGEMVTSVAASSAAVLSAVACTCSGRAARRAAAKATAKAAAAKKAAKSQSQPPPAVRKEDEEEEQVPDAQEPPPPPLSKAADTAAVVAAAETVAPATPPSTLTLPLAGAKNPADDTASVVDEKEAEAAAKEADRLSAKMLKPAKWLREKVRLSIGLKGRLMTRWVVLQGDLLWIMHASLKDEEGREAEVKELGKMSEYVVNVNGATVQSMKDKCGGVITITGLRAFHFQAIKLFFGSHTALLRWKHKLDAAVGQAGLPDKLEKALKRSASAPSRAAAAAGSSSRATSQTRSKPDPNSFSQALTNLNTTATTTKTLSPGALSATGNTGFEASYASYGSVSAANSAMGDELTSATTAAVGAVGTAARGTIAGGAAERSASVPAPSVPLAAPQLSGVSIGSTSPSSTTQQLHQLQQQLQSLQEQARQVHQQQQQEYQQQSPSHTGGNWSFPQGLRAGNVLEPSPYHGTGGSISAAESVVGSVGARTLSAVPGENLTPRSSASGNGKGFGSRSEHSRIPPPYYAHTTGSLAAPVTPISPPSSVLGFSSPGSAAAPPGGRFGGGSSSYRSRERLLQHRSGAITPPAATRKQLTGGFPISGYYAWRAQLQAAQQQLLECEQHAESLYQFFPRNRWQRPDGSRTPTRMYSSTAPPSSISPAASVSGLSQSGNMGGAPFPPSGTPPTRGMPPTATTSIATATPTAPALATGTVSVPVPSGIPMEPIAATMAEGSPGNDSSLWGSPSYQPGGYSFIAGQTPTTAAGASPMGSPHDPILPPPRPISKLTEGGYGLEYGVPPPTRPGLA